MSHKKQKPGAGQREVAQAIAALTDRLAMARAVIVLRGPDGRDEPVGAIISMVELARLEPTTTLHEAKQHLAEARLALEAGKQATAMQHLCDAFERLTAVLGAQGP